MEVAKKRIGKIKTSSAILESAPFIGRVEEFLKGRKVIYRYLVCGNYKIVYSVDDRDKMVRIADVFDTRQHPVKIKRKK